MWLKEKIIQGQRRILLRPEKVEFIRLVEYGRGQGDGTYFLIGIDGVEYHSRQKIELSCRNGHLLPESARREGLLV